MKESYSTYLISKFNRFGYGRMYYSNGDSWEGNWKDNIIDGQATYKYSNGDIFVGLYKNGKKEGPGKMVIKCNKEIIEADWQNDMKEGKGKIYSEHGKIKIVKWKYDKPLHSAM